MITNTQQLSQAFLVKAMSGNLEVQCGGDGPFSAMIAVVAEAPGAREVQTKLPLVGTSGAKLWEQLRKYGIDRRQVYVTNVSKRLLAETRGDTGRAKINIGKHETDLWASLLRWELMQLPNLRYVLVLGNMALEAITGHTGISNWRGSVLDHVTIQDANSARDVTVVCTYNPAMVLHEPKTEVTFRTDIGKFNKVLKGEWKPYIINGHINPTLNEAMEYLDSVQRSRRLIAYDIETIGRETACIGFANDTHSGMCINFRDRKTNRYDVHDEMILRRKCASVLSDPHLDRVAQNGMYDMGWLWYKDRIKPGPLKIDTMLAHHTLYPILPHSIAYMVAQYTDHPFYKDEKDVWREGGDIDTFWHYNVKDCCLTLRVAYSLMEELRDQQLDKFFYSHVQRLQWHLVLMVVGGVRIDTTLKDKLASVLVEQVNALRLDFERKAAAATGLSDYYPNPNSPKDLTDLFFSKLRLVGRGVSTDATNREKMFAHPRTTEPAREVLTSLNAFKEEAKFYSTYATMEIDPDSRIRCEYTQTGVTSAPGRLSSRKTLWGSGMNLQNQPERAYEMFVADDPDYVLGYIDGSQAEARYVGWDYNIEKWIEDFERARFDGSYDAHRALASDMFHVPYEDVPKFDRYPLTPEQAVKLGVAFDPEKAGKVTIRFTAKRCRHGLNYRMGAPRLAEKTGLSLREAEKAYSIYHTTNPEIMRGWTATENEAKRNGMLFNSYGRRWLLMERITPEALESIIAFKPQSTIGDHTCRVIYMCHDDDQWDKRSRVAMNTHDGLVALLHKDTAKRCLSIMKKHAEHPILVRNRELIIPAECKMSQPDQYGIHRWSTLKQVQIEAAR